MKSNALWPKAWLILLAAAALAGCKKSDPATARIIKTVSHINQDDSVIYAYSPDGKLLGMRNYRGSLWTTLEYSGNRVTEQIVLWSVNQQFQNVYYLNSNGIADSMIRIQNGQPFCFQFYYNADGIRTLETSGCAERSTGMTKTVENGNVTKRVLYGNGEIMQTGYYEYYPEFPYRPNTVSEEQMGYPFLGKQSKNLIKKMVLVGGNSDTLLNNRYFYHFDDYGRISSVGVYASLETPADSIEYFY